ncbi:MAG TPA: hypothetical protein VNV42_16230 [Solirubrobacteraceae bacterium]|jgi:hypothetical protein|nr:hypothetical protein [Solirubrobacteraceae bacterium]
MRLLVMLAAASADQATQAPPARADVPYCFRLVASFTDCAAYSGNTYANGVWDQNAAQYPGSGTVSVCEHTYIVGGETISNRCANQFVDSLTQLCVYYELNIEQSAHAVNHSAQTHTIEGYAFNGNGDGNGDPEVC